MNKLYLQKDLGYKRPVTTATFRVEMLPDGSLWSVPVQAIVDSRDEHYSSDKEDTIGSIRAGHLDAAEIYDWAGNNMNWSDVSDYAIEIKKPNKAFDWEEKWSNGEKEISGIV